MPSSSSRTSLTPREFQELSPAAQFQHLLQVDAPRKAALLLEAKNGSALMAALPVQEAYLMVKALGPDQVPELLALAGPEQWTGFFDFECWTGDRLDAGRARTWVALLLQTDEMQMIATLQQMNFELLILLIKKEVRVLAGPETIEDDDARVEAVRRDGGYQLDYRDEDGAKLYGALLDRLANADPEFFRYLMESVRAESESLIEESVFQQRGGRLLDLGFPEPFAAREIYARLDPATFRSEEHRKYPLGLAERTLPPGFPLMLARPEGLLKDILAAGLDGAGAWELASLVNKVAMADRIDIGDVGAVRDVIQKTCGLLNLGLEYLAAGDADTAGRLFRDVYSEHLFRLGFSLTQDLQRRAQALADSTIGPYLDPPLRAFLEPLLEAAPRYYTGLEPEGSAEKRWFQSLGDIRLCREWLDHLEVQRRLFEDHFHFTLASAEEYDLEGQPLPAGDDQSLSEIFLTALANRLLGRDFRPQPLGGAELSELHQQVCRNGQLRTELVEETLSWLETLEEGGGAFGEYCLTFWQETLCPVPAGEINPRYIAGILVKAGPGTPERD